MISICQRYIFIHFFRLFIFFLLSFYAIYVLIDYATHSQNFFYGSSVSLIKITQYYFLQFLKRINILFPLSLLISIIRTLSSFNKNREILALLTSGISKKHFLRPFIFSGMACSAIIFFLNETAIPFSLKKIDHFYDTYLHTSLRNKKTQPIGILRLEDHSRLIYQHYDPSKKVFFDVIWLKSVNDIWKIKHLKTDSEYPEGFWVDHLQRDFEGKLQKLQSYKRKTFSKFSWNHNLSEMKCIPFENHSISQLCKLWKYDQKLSLVEKNEIKTQILFKMVSPLFSLLVVIAVCPLCIKFSPLQRTATLYAISIFSFVTLIAFLDSVVIMCENAILSPFLVIVLPFTALLIIFGLKFSRD